LNQPNFEAAIAYALHRLSAELPAEMTYHSSDHTRSEVMPAAVEFGRLARLSDHELDLLRVAAAFHDLGFIERPDDHEMCSARIAAQVLPAFAFAARAIERVMSLILATHLPQSPRNYLEQLMCDADLSGLGSADFPARSVALLDERRALGQEVAVEQWWREQIEFVAQHRYWTEIAEGQRAAGKARNLEWLRGQLEQAQRSGANA
jgi:predicted metal-dependent HD superfamily phosphohydrolase